MVKKIFTLSAPAIFLTPQAKYRLV